MLEPQLRFPEFSGEYQTVSLSDIAYSVKRKNTDHQTDIPLTISATEGLVDQRTYFERTNNEKDLSKYIRLKRGEFAYNKSFSNGYPFGAIKRLTRYESGALSSVYLCFALKNDAAIDSDYLSQYFNSTAWHSAMVDICEAGARNHGILNVKAREFFEALHVLSLSKEEQEKVAGFLGLYDQKIEAQKEKISAMERRRTGLIQQIFSREIRFKADDGSEFPDWTHGTIGSFLQARNELQIPTEEAPLKAFVAYLGVTDKENTYDRAYLLKGDPKKKYKRTEKNDFIYSSNNLDVGSIGLNTYGTAVISDVYEVFSIRDGNVPMVVDHAIRQRDVINKIVRFRQGCVAGQYRIHASDFLSVEMALPSSIEEQRKIENLLVILNEQIRIEKEKLEAIMNVKRGLLQQMFV